MPSHLRHPRPWLKAFWHRAYQENVTGLSAMVAYNLMLAVFPFALLVLFVFGQVLKIEGVETSVVNGYSSFARQPSHGPPSADKRTERRPNPSHWLGQLGYRRATDRCS